MFEFYSMPRKPKSISKDKIPSIAASLKAKAKTPITVTLEELVLSLGSPIQEMLDAGYSYSDVSAVFASHGVELAASGIKSYHLKSQRTKPSSEPSSETQTEPGLPEPEPGLPEPEPGLPEPELKPQKGASGSKVSAKSKFNVTDRSKI